MTTQPTPDPTLVQIDARLRQVETQVADIHRAMVGSTDGTAKGLQARVERLEAWARWLAGAVTALILGAAQQLMRGGN